MFDEQVEDLFDDDRVKANEIYQRLSSKWLAEIRIPFYTIYAMQRVTIWLINIAFISMPTLLFPYISRSKVYLR